MSDAINPSHYKQGSVETIEIIEAAIAKAPSNKAAGLHWQVLKYVLRCWHKNGTEDLKKARWYLDRLIGVLEAGGVEQPVTNAPEVPASPPTEPQYRDVTEADVGMEVEVSDEAGAWYPQTQVFSGFIDPSSRMGRAGYHFETDGCCHWRFARIKIGGEA